MLALFEDRQILPHEVLVDLGKFGVFVVQDPGWDLGPTEALEGTEAVESGDESPIAADQDRRQETDLLDAGGDLGDGVVVDGSEAPVHLDVGDGDQDVVLWLGFSGAFPGCWSGHVDLLEGGVSKMAPEPGKRHVSVERPGPLRSGVGARDLHPMAEQSNAHGGRRPGAGRPFRHGERPQQVAPRLPVSLVGWLDAAAEERGLSRSAAAVEILRKTKKLADLDPPPQPTGKPGRPPRMPDEAVQVTLRLTESLVAEIRDQAHREAISLTETIVRRLTAAI